MTVLEKPLIWCARHGRYLLVAGLLAGIFIEPMALLLKAHIPEMVGLMLLVAAFRVGMSAAIGAGRDLRLTLIVTLAYQVAVPLVLIACFAFAGFGISENGVIGWQAALAGALVLMAAGPSISGSPNLAILCGADPAPALRLMVIGTALLPLTVLPVFWLMPQLGGGMAVLVPAARLLVVIGFCAAAGFTLRRVLSHRVTPSTLQAADGLSAILMMVVVIGLMSAVGPALRENTGLLIGTLFLVFVFNFGFQVLAFVVLGQVPGIDTARVPVSIVAGNRNMALFLTALPAAVTEPMLLFIGCYQIPMYLTPILLSRFYRAA
ncbi:hypothetical protein [Salaquimonas pukyongi]|uniref:hypothetical protein n=1 Tax=Salaquimonas pukyongi TaxID=2712698 RepID=UPI00096B9C67|nr:hypothetical protein [Salaquimonas pukyongi]